MFLKILSEQLAYLKFGYELPHLTADTQTSCIQSLNIYAVASRNRQTAPLPDPSQVLSF